MASNDIANGNATMAHVVAASDDDVDDSALPMFQIADPLSSAPIDLDDIFSEMYYLDMLVGGEANDASASLSLVDSPSDPQDTATTTTTTTAGKDSVQNVVAPTPVTSSVPSSSAGKRSADQAKLVAANKGDDDDDEGGGTVALTEAQIVEKRERNREHAKRSRLRKKFLLESCQDQIRHLEEQLDQFKEALRTEVPEKADSIIQSVCGDQNKFVPVPMPSGFGPVKTLMEPDFRLMAALSGSQQNFAISDPTLPDNPIVFVSQGFLDLTGYTREEVLGRNCRFLQGPGTDQKAVEVIRRGIAEGVDTSVCLLNYRADGSAFWNQFMVAALRDADDNVVNFVGIQCEVSKAVVEKQMGAALRAPTRSKTVF